MTDRVSSDHDSVTTHRVRIARVGGTDRPEIGLPADVGVDPGDSIRVVLDGEACHGYVDDGLDGGAVLRWVADNARQARERDGVNRLAEWIGDGDRGPGDSVHLDVVTPGYAYGLRTPGTTVVYDATAAPDPSLADIAADLEE